MAEIPRVPGLRPGIFNTDGQETAAFAQAFDWSSHPLGGPEDWPAALRTALSIVFNNRQPMFLFWGDQHYCFYNDGYLPIVSAAKHPWAMGRPGAEVWAEAWPLLIPQIEQVRRQGRATWNENHLVPVLKNGKLEDSYFTYSYSPVFLESGAIGGTLVTCTETTEQVKAQREIERQNERFRELANSMPQIVWTATPEGVFDYYNERWYEFTGFDRGGAGDQSWVHVLHPDDVERGLASWCKSVETGEDFQSELRFKDSKSGYYRWFIGRAIPVRDELGKITKWIGSSTDIDEQKRTEAQVIDILESMSDAFFSIDKDWKITRLNAQHEKITHYKREEQIGQGLLDLFFSMPEARESKYWVNYHKAMSERVPVQFEDYYPPFDLWTQVRAYPTPDGGLAVFFTDTTAPKKTNQQIEKLASDLQQAVIARDEFLSIASHELKTPVTSLKMQLQMTRRQVKPEQNIAPSPAQLAKTLDLSNRQVDRLTALIEDLLDVSRIESGKMTYNFEPVDLTELVREVIERFAEPMKSLQCPLEVSVPASLTVTCDRFRIEQVVTNLITNAMKYGAGSAIEVKLEPLADGAGISVSDGGIGIAKDQQGKIFDRFERATLNSNISGLGLGLYITRQIVDAHGGDIQLRSQLGEGSTFTVRLPGARPPRCAAPRRGAPHAVNN